MRFWQQYQHTGVKASSDTVSPPHPTSWLPSSSGSFKLNVDASFGSQSSGFGFVLRDHIGLIILSGVGPLHTALSAFHAECLGLWKSFANVHYRSISLLIIESDCLSLVTQLQSNGPNLSPFGHLLETLRSLLFPSIACSLIYSPRSTNVVVHSVAQLGHGLSTDVLWEHTSHHSVFGSLHREWLCCNDI